ncbi:MULTISPECIES: glycoside hydrolase family 127 protein [Bifidobacterium]|uniref:glycoside hydrolase family 127 protein n=1 Tax=Bifidobacterium TaxID=1678 RepID=UPI001BDCEF78|nr:MULTISPECIES: glycoside hydrolase family 127 protein [Bifidobacterium]MBT1160596.1 glycoside hydrolase family 127 protein [Bifidobacterium sp. SO1]MBW3078521.1 glycoside hydrolase family 127 protein [Bifidobacterium simiiventris]
MSTASAQPNPTAQHSKPLALRNVIVTDPFWHTEQELVRTAVIPFQWNALNDNVPGAAPSYCMHNFKAAAAQNQRKNTEGKKFVPPAYTYRGFESKPEDPKHPDPDKFYGFVFQDTDFSKWIEAVGYSLTQHPDAELEATADGAIDIVCAAQLDNGYLDTYYILNGMDRAFHNLRWHHELYCLGHLIEGAIAYYEGTGKDKLLKAAERFADYVGEYFGPKEGQCKGYPGHEIAEMALARLADLTGEKKYLDLAKFFIDERGTEPNYFIYEGERDKRDGYSDTNWTFDCEYTQADKPVREQKEAVGHAVRAGYLYSGMAAVAKLTDDASLVEACENLWRNIVDKKLYITGGIGGTVNGEAFSYDYDLPNDAAYSESCAAISLAFFARRMLEIAPKAEYADVMEQALYNTTLAGMALDGKSFFYVNPLEVNPYACHKDNRVGHVKPVRQKWFGCACCPPNIARIVESVQEYAYTVSDDTSTLFTHLYMGGVARATLGGADVTLDVAAELPWKGDGAATVRLGSEESADVASAATFTLAFRLPGWAGSTDAAAGAISASGEADGRVVRAVRDGYVYFTGQWRDGDEVTFDFPMPVRMMKANPMVREDAGRVAFVRGPITFCAEERDNGANLHLLHADVAAILADPSSVKVVPFEFHAGAAGIDADGQGEVDEVTRDMVKLEVPAWREPVPAGASAESPAFAPLYAEYRPAKREPVTATLIPYFAWANRGENEMTVFLHD